MEQNAGSFDAISDSFGAVQIKGQQLAAGLTAAIAPALAQIAETLNSTDLTGLGEALGSIASAAINLGAVLTQMVPQILGVVTAMALFKTGFDAKVMTMFSTLGPKAIAAFAQVRGAMLSISWSGFATAGRTALMGVAAAARTAGIAIKGALISTGVGILIAALASGIEFIMSKLDQAKEAVRRVEEASKDSANTVRGLGEEFKTISSESDKIQFGENVDREIDRVKDKLAELNSDDSLSASQREDIAVHYRIEIGLLEKMKASMQNITPEIMAQRQAEKDRAEALEESRRAAAGLNKELAKRKESLDEKIEQDKFSQLSSTEQRDSVLGDLIHLYVAQHRRRARRRRSLVPGLGRGICLGSEVPALLDELRELLLFSKHKHRPKILNPKTDAESARGHFHEHFFSFPIHDDSLPARDTRENQIHPDI
jgi:hypothetical protein